MSILPPFTPIYPFEGFQECLATIQQATDQYDDESSKTSNPFIGFAIDACSFLTYFENGEENMLSLSWEMYDHTNHILRIKMTSFEHEMAKGTFCDIFTDWHRSHRRDRLAHTSAQTVRGQHGTKQPDESWRPEYPPQGRGHKWPTIAVEVAWSERRRKIHQDMEFWLAQSKGKVTVALSITVTRASISIERWKSKPRDDRMVSHPTQKIEIARKAAPKCPRIHGHLEIPFEDIYLRQKQKDETDFVLTEENMEEMARMVWRL